jgi:hypothetical protein
MSAHRIVCPYSYSLLQCGYQLTTKDTGTIAGLQILEHTAATIAYALYKNPDPGLSLTLLLPRNTLTSLLQSVAEEMKCQVRCKERKKKRAEEFQKAKESCLLTVSPPTNRVCLNSR